MPLAVSHVPVLFWFPSCRNFVLAHVLGSDYLLLFQVHALPFSNSVRSCAGRVPVSILSIITACVFCQQSCYAVRLVVQKAFCVRTACSATWLSIIILSSVCVYSKHLCAAWKLLAKHLFRRHLTRLSSTHAQTS